MNNKEIVSFIAESYGFMKKFVKVEETKLGSISKGIGTISYIEEVVFTVITDKKIIKFSLSTENGLKVVSESQNTGDIKPEEKEEKEEIKAVPPTQKPFNPQTKK